AGQAGGEGDAPPRTVSVPARVVDLTQREAALDGSEVTARGGGRTTVTFAADVLFDTDRSDLRREARARLDQIAAQLEALGPRRVTITGHTDDRGTPEHNQALSERRAEVVRAHLGRQLDDAFRLEARGYGETRPVAPNTRPDGSDDPEGRARNRRVVIAFSTG
ncbi:MAG TPA: OmpA family protein, partial [Acidimicrobiales bacterium]